MVDPFSSMMVISDWVRSQTYIGHGRKVADAKMVVGRLVDVIDYCISRSHAPIYRIVSDYGRA